MNCKNCLHIIPENADYCESCGAKVIRERITLKRLKNDFFNNILGFDNLFIRTIVGVITSPDKVISEYVSGTRKRYMNPFAFLVIGTAVATFVFNFFSDKYIEFALSAQNESYYETMFSLTKPNLDKNTVAYQEQFLLYKEEQKEINRGVQNFMLKYFNFMAFLMIPFYAFLSLLVFGKKKYNYGEHLVINSYLLGLGLFSGTLFFLLGLVTDPMIYLLSSLIIIFYYSYTYKKLGDYSTGQILLKFLRFLVVLILLVLVISILIFVLAFIGAVIYSSLNK
ncbi:DUF3667 domain-containing protein [Aquimarina litoralis]|uniref:DUF3667 domain-containing protein n=1 Tax=Aquimarina litoralis TaxID=584605 RepID=UPI001C56C018|nr:DUF3667 domain-containing protein [Aquimarina litoralis]MBW1296103.1 DUF3667 domain-containing protein [Aquimarina litoralis]